MLRTLITIALALTCAACASTDSNRKGAAPATVAPETSAEEAPAEEAASTDSATAPSASNLNLADIPFAPFNPEQPEGINVFPISGDFKAGPFTAIARFPAGYRSPLHSHTANYTGVAVSEGLVHGATADATGALPKGSFWFQPAGEPHVDACESEEPCYLLATFDGAVDMVPTDTPAAEPTVHVTHGDKVEWVEVKAGVQMAVIHGNPKEGAFQALFQFPAGMTTNVHTHTASFSGALLSGTHHRGPNADQLVTLSAGAVWSEPAGSAHMEKCGDEGPCVIAGAMDGALDTEAVELTPAATE
jgi:quercetin dioxygenase-like cupin family protein